MLRPIQGCWFEIQHHSPAEGRHWNEAARRLTAAQWQQQARDMMALGMDRFVLTTVALDGKTFYPSNRAARHDLVAEDPVEALLSAVAEGGGKVYVGNDFFGSTMAHGQALLEPAQVRVRLAAMEELVARYGHHPSFGGWYYPHECCIAPTFDDSYMKYVEINSREARRLTPGAEILIAPYGTRHARFDAEFARQLERLDVDLVAYQDEVGVEKSTPDETPRFFETLRRAHEAAGRSALWADVELFRFEGEVYKSALRPAPFERILRQLEAVSPFVDGVLGYQYTGLLNRPGTRAFLGTPDTETLYSEYADWLARRTD